MDNAGRSGDGKVVLELSRYKVIHIWDRSMKSQELVGEGDS
jgi:hypothetical protein